MKLVALLSFVCLAAAAPWDDSVEHKYVDKHGRIVEVEYERVPWFGKVPAATTGSAVAAVRAAAAVGGLPNQFPARFVLNLDDDDYVVRSGGKYVVVDESLEHRFGLVGAPLLKAAGPDGKNVYFDGSGELLYTLDDKNNIVPLVADHPLLKSAAPGENPFLIKESVEMLGDRSYEVVYSPGARPQGVASPAGASMDAVVSAKK